jgi:tetratricopeptide (TPR) repeat protein
VLCAGLGVLAQDAGLTLFDEIENADERTALRRVWAAAEPAMQQRLATDFVAAFPASVALREAYELGARASIALGEPQRALDWAGRALRLLPENPLLLVMTADVAAKTKQLELAESSAREALRLLATADAPASITPETWARTRARLQANAYVALALVAAEQKNYAESRRSLLMSLTLEDDHDEALYVLGVVNQALGRDGEAAEAFAEATRSTGPLSKAATDALRPLFDKQPNRHATFESYVASLRFTPPRAPVRASSPPAGEYAGSDACRDCHRRVYDRCVRHPGRRVRPVDALSRRLRDRLEVATGICHTAQRLAHRRVPCSVQPHEEVMAELLEPRRRSELGANGHLAVPSGAGRGGLRHVVCAVPHEPAAGAARGVFSRRRSEL